MKQINVEINMMQDYKSGRLSKNFNQDHITNLFNKANHLIKNKEQFMLRRETAFASKKNSYESTDAPVKAKLYRQLDEAERFLSKTDVKPR
jgi:hypothetical protein